MFILLKSATSGDNKTWNNSISTDANQMKLVSTPLFSGMRNLFLLLLVHIFTTGGNYKQLNTISTKILTHKFLDWKVGNQLAWFWQSTVNNMYKLTINHKILS